MTWTEDELYRFYTDKDIVTTYEKMIKSVGSQLGFTHDYIEFNDEKNILFYRDSAMLDSHLENGYHLDHNGEGCFGIESKNISMNHIATLHTFDTLNDFDPDDTTMTKNPPYYYLFVLPEPVETSPFSARILRLSSCVLNNTF